jgi:predicted nucleic-acid-binding Zn-ribbon protein
MGEQELGVTCINENAEDLVQKVVFDLTPAMVDRIQVLSDTLKAVGAEYISEFNYQGVWVNQYGTEVRIEIPMLEVSKDGWRLTAVPKHSGDDCLLQSSYQPIPETDTAVEVRMLCPECRSETVFWDATVYWDVTKQAFEWDGNRYKTINCGNCGAEFDRAEEV